MFCATGIPGTKQIKISQNKQTEKLNIDIDAWLSFCFTCNMNLYNQFLLPHHCFHGSSPIGHGNSLFSRPCSPKHRAPFKWCLWAVLALITSQLSPVPLGDNHNPHSTQGHVAGPPASLMQPTHRTPGLYTTIFPAPLWLHLFLLHNFAQMSPFHWELSCLD